MKSANTMGRGSQQSTVFNFERRLRDDYSDSLPVATRILPATVVRHARLSNVILAVLVAAVSIVATAGRVNAQAPLYDMMILKQPFKDSRYAIPTGMDEWGNVIGYHRLLETSIDIGFCYDRQADAYTFSEVGHIWLGTNNLGQLVGGDQNVEPEAAIWRPKFVGPYVGGQALYWENPSAAPVALLPLPGELWTGAGAINDAGLIVGLSWPNFNGAPAPVTAAVWQVTGSGVSAPLALPALPNDLFVVAEGISEPNGSGVCTIVGRSGSMVFGDAGETAVRWRVKIKNNGQLVLKEGPIALGMPSDGEVNGSAAYASTTKAFVTGSLGYDAFKKSKTGSARLLKSFKIDGVSPFLGAGMSIDEMKNIVGYQSFRLSPLRRTGQRAVLWPGGKAPIDLTSVVELPNRKRLSRAIDINGSGEILAIRSGGGNTRPVILIPRVN